MREMKWTPERERTSQVAQVIVGIVFFILVTGLWACLWVPPPIF